MKQIFGLLVLYLFSATIVVSQVSEKKVKIAGENRDALVIGIDGNADEVQQAWKKYLRSELGIKAETKKGDLMLKEQIIPALCEKHIDFYSSAEEADGKTQLAAAIGLGYDNYASASNERAAYDKLRNTMSAFATDWQKQLMADKTSAAMDELKTSEKNLENLDDEIKKLEKSAEKAKEDITEAEKTIKEQKEKLGKAESDAKKLRESRAALAKEVEQKKKLVENAEKEEKKVK